MPRQPDRSPYNINWNYEWLSKHFTYNPTTGDLFRKGSTKPVRSMRRQEKPAYRCQVHTPDGSVDQHAEIVAWLLSTPHLPLPTRVRHINLNKLDNRACNLFAEIVAPMKWLEEEHPMMAANSTRQLLLISTPRTDAYVQHWRENHEAVKLKSVVHSTSCLEAPNKIWHIPLPTETLVHGVAQQFTVAAVSAYSTLPHGSWAKALALPPEVLEEAALSMFDTQCRWRPPKDFWLQHSGPDPEYLERLARTEEEDRQYEAALSAKQIEAFKHKLPVI